MATNLDEEPIRPSRISAPSANPPQTANALFKLIGSNSDSESENSPLQKAGPRLLSRLRPQSEDRVLESEESDNGEAVYERMKKRLLLTKTVDTFSSEDEEDDRGEGAYERMKKRLMARTGPLAHQQSLNERQKSTATAPPAASSEDDDTPVQPVRTRRLQSKKELNVSSPLSHSPTVRSRRSSPGLFVSPEASPSAKKQRQIIDLDGDASDVSETRPHNADLQERVRRIRAERLASQNQMQELHKRTKAARRLAAEESESNSDGENSRRLTQQSKPTRKASKKAMEAMEKEQQRIKRGMQLAHQAKTRKRYSTKDLFTILGYNQGIGELQTEGLPTPDESSLPATPGAESDRPHNDTPPTSPPSFENAPKKDQSKISVEPPSTTTHSQEAIPSTAAKLDKGKGRAPEFQHLPPNPSVQRSESITVRSAQVTNPTNTSPSMVDLSDSEDDLEIEQPLSRFSVFDKIPEKKKHEASSLLHLRHLANLTSPGKKAPKGRPSMNMAELQLSLQRKGRQQAQKEREEKIEELRRKGIHIETEEEREKRQMEVEDMVAQFEKAREEDLKLSKLERDQAKKNGETGDGLSSDESEDDDYIASGEENVGEDDGDDMEEPAELELSGSEDEEPEDESDDQGDVDEHETEDKANTLLDDMADESDDGHKQPCQGTLSDDEEHAEGVEPAAPVWRGNIRRARNVVVDEEDDDDQAQPTGSTIQAASQDDTMAAFGFGNTAPALGLTQAFAGTMANMGSGSQHDLNPLEDVEQDSLDFLRNLPDTQPDASLAGESLIPNSQTITSQLGCSQEGPASQINLGISQLIETSPAFSRTQLSELPEPTQDTGLVLSRSPGGLVAPPSTIDTVMMPVAESPLQERKGKLRRGRKQLLVELSDDDVADVSSGSDIEAQERPTKNTDIFSVMKKAARKQQKIDDFNKKTSWAKEAVDEQAEESEDEYAGIGGASDEDSGDEADEELAKMIDTEDVKIDERKIAAYYAEKSKKDDEKNINQLYKDLMSGNLRKRAGRDAFDMSDSEDEADMRRRKRQREFQQMTRALVQDERIGKIAQDAKQAAFFNTLLDHFDDPEYEFLNPEELTTQSSQSQLDEFRENDENVSIPDSQTVPSVSIPAINPLKRKANDSQEKENRPPPNLRRTAASDSLTRKPMSLADVQHSVSELLEDPRVMVPDSQYSSEEEDEPVVPLKPTKRQPIVDRLTLSRTSTSSESTASGANVAFHAPSASMHQPGFRVPSLIRRATSNFSTVSERSSSGTNTPVEGGVRRGGSGKSNVHAQAREAERRLALEKAEMKRKEAVRRKAGKARGKRSILRDLGGGFE